MIMNLMNACLVQRRFWLLTGLLMAAAGCSRGTPGGPAVAVVRPGEAAPGEPPATQPVVMIDTRSLESGERKLEDTSSLSLELLLHDLIGRRDYDRSQHDGQAGPDGPYLERWMAAISADLERRGYIVEADGTLHRPGNGATVDMR